MPLAPHPPPELVHKGGYFLLPRQDGGPKVEGPLLLAKPAARHGHDPSLLQQPEAVEHVGRLACCLGGCDGLGGQLQLREGEVREG